MGDGHDQWAIYRSAIPGIAIIHSLYCDISSVLEFLKLFAI